MKAIFIEVSFPDEQPDQQLFGHLTPQWLMQEMDKLSDLAGKESLKAVKIFITISRPEKIGKNKSGSN
ncbi:hypothetical protein [Flavihumibacter fluvii]|uniref:hypothetical protein n=1 Tax=Flavihumibacter fluvii TaxID=2838157 RepID=UPI001BDE79A8|nr:hypothetical protein [Flavihumibacter fluvii]